MDFFRSLFNVPFTVPTAGLFLETGSYRIGTIIKARRLNFLHTMVKLDKKEMLSQFFLAQWDNPGKLDWVKDAMANLVEFGLPTNLETIHSMSTNVFKNLVKKKAKILNLEVFLN